MPFFISNPVRIEARQFESRSFDHMQELVAWVNGSGPRGCFHDGRVIVIPTLEGAMVGSVGDWIIKGTRGEFYPCKPDVFAVKYSPASTGDSDAV
jgi:hypothetical protein